MKTKERIIEYRNELNNERKEIANKYQSLADKKTKHAKALEMKWDRRMEAISTLNWVLKDE